MARLLCRSASPRQQLQAIHRSLAVAEFDPEGRVLEANSRFLALMEHAPADVRGRHHRLFVDPQEAAQPAYGEFWERLVRGEGFAGRCRRITGEGREVWLQAHYSPVLDGRGRVERVVQYAMDISAEVRRETDMRRELAAVDRAQAVAEFALDGRLLRANRNFLDALGYAREEDVVGCHHGIFAPPGERQGPGYRAFWEQLAQGRPQQGRFLRIGRDGREVWLQAQYSPVLDRDGQPFKVVHHALDVTARELAAERG